MVNPHRSHSVPAFLSPLPVFSKMPARTTSTPRRKPSSSAGSSTGSSSHSRSGSSSGSEKSLRAGNEFGPFSYPAKRQTMPVKASTPLASRERHYVFVYGTLKKGFPNAHYLDRSTFLGEFRTTTRYPLVVGGRYYSPYLLDLPNKGSKVKGEVYVVDDATLADLDYLENVGVNYERRVGKVSCVSDRAFVVEAYVYFKVNGMEGLIRKSEGFLEEYRDRRYVPRHLRPKEEPVAARR